MQQAKNKLGLYLPTYKEVLVGKRFWSCLRIEDSSFLRFRNLPPKESTNDRISLKNEDPAI